MGNAQHPLLQASLPRFYSNDPLIGEFFEESFPCQSSQDWRTQKTHILLREGAHPVITNAVCQSLHVLMKLNNTIQHRASTSFLRIWIWRSQVRSGRFGLPCLISRTLQRTQNLRYSSRSDGFIHSPYLSKTFWRRYWIKFPYRNCWLSTLSGWSERWVWECIIDFFVADNMTICAFPSRSTIEVFLMIDASPPSAGRNDGDSKSQKYSQGNDTRTVTMQRLHAVKVKIVEAQEDLCIWLGLRSCERIWRAPKTNSRRFVIMGRLRSFLYGLRNRHFVASTGATIWN